ncbi:hypothetical protein B0T18DRAFT_409811 [Schizothecium vesticola]|uniref:Uncharacterized protein n=1 Tax=Schizothecium vesticola TaxID=314040 RepID=A0AA40EU47_9PEZI|nr:hypothetical protein B0T18DRAFT_409811 [Schizothecium vesticola]
MVHLSFTIPSTTSLQPALPPLLSSGFFLSIRRLQRRLVRLLCRPDHLFVCLYYLFFSYQSFQCTRDTRPTINKITMSPSTFTWRQAVLSALLVPTAFASPAPITVLGANGVNTEVASADVSAVGAQVDAATAALVDGSNADGFLGGNNLDNAAVVVEDPEAAVLLNDTLLLNDTGIVDLEGKGKGKDQNRVDDLIRGGKGREDRQLQELLDQLFRELGVDDKGKGKDNNDQNAQLDLLLQLFGQNGLDVGKGKGRDNRGAEDQLELLIQLFGLNGFDDRGKGKGFDNFDDLDEQQFLQLLQGLGGLGGAFGGGGVNNLFGGNVNQDQILNLLLGGLGGGRGNLNQNDLLNLLLQTQQLGGNNVFGGAANNYLAGGGQQQIAQLLQLLGGGNQGFGNAFGGGFGNNGKSGKGNDINALFGDLNGNNGKGKGSGVQFARDLPRYRKRQDLVIPGLGENEIEGKGKDNEGKGKDNEGKGKENEGKGKADEGKGKADELKGKADGKGKILLQCESVSEVRKRQDVNIQIIDVDVEGKGKGKEAKKAKTVARKLRARRVRLA